MGKEDRGFASMDRAKQREIASKGGKAAHAKGTAHEWTSEEAKLAGRKGGMISRGGKGRRTTTTTAPAAPVTEIMDPVVDHSVTEFTRFCDESPTGIPPRDAVERGIGDENKPMCTGMGGGFYCTRPPSHEGDHVAHGHENYVLARWPRVVESPHITSNATSEPIGAGAGE